MSKRIHDVVQTGADVRKLMEAIANGMDSTDIEESLNALGLDVEVDTIDFGNEFATITIEGGENETGCILTLKLVKVEVGFDTLNIGEGTDEDPGE